MSLRALYRDAVRKYRKEGAVRTAKAGAVFLGRYVTGGVGTSSYQTDRRVDIDQRFSMIEPHLSPGDENLLDVGCAEGELTKRFADGALFCLGIDISDIRLAQARKKESLDNSVRFLRHEITPENVSRLPGFDVTLLLAVYQHWGSQFGFEAAAEMLRVLAGDTGKLFFEVPPGKQTSDVFPPREDEGDVEYYRRYLEDVFDDGVAVEHIGTADYKGEGRTDPVFLLECGAYEYGG